MFGFSKKKKAISKIADGKDFLNLLLEVSQLKEDDAYKKRLIQLLEVTSTNIGTILFQRALQEKIITIDEVDKSKLSIIDWGTILQVVFAKEDKHIIMEEPLKIVTLQNTQIFNEKNWIENKFEKYKISIVTPEEVTSNISM